MSVEWSRLEPHQGTWDEDSFQHYRRMILALRSRGIRPILCLFHFTLPIWAEEAGGFENPAIIRAFVRFSRKCAEAFGDLVEHWLTLNEPVVYALGAYAAGLTPPGVKDIKRALKVIVNLIRAHSKVYHVLKSQSAQFQVSFAQHLRVFTPKNKLSPLDQWGAKIASEVLNWAWYKTIQSGKIHVKVPTIFEITEESPASLGAMDFLGFNYYGRDLISVNPFSKEKFHISTPKNAEKTDMGWEIYPQGLVSILRGIKAHNLGSYPILMTENGLADARDAKRSRFIFDHLQTFLKTSQELGLNPLGYLHWSLIDNFEWIDGFHPRFGLFEVDYKLQKRSPRPSAHYFRELGRSKTLTTPP